MCDLNSVQVWGICESYPVECAKVRFMFPLDWQLNTIVDGQFTVEEDRLVVAKLGEVAVDAKIQSLKEQGAICVFRWFVANRARHLTAEMEVS